MLASEVRFESSKSRQLQPGEPLLATQATSLRREPLVSAPMGLPLPIAEPLQGLARWHDGQDLWLRVLRQPGGEPPAVACP